MKTKAFQKGHKKVGGRQKGTPNRINGDVRDRILAQVTPEEIIADIQKVDDPGRRAELKMKMLEFVIPKPQRVTINNTEGQEPKEMVVRFMEPINLTDEVEAFSELSPDKQKSILKKAKIKVATKNPATKSERTAEPDDSYTRKSDPPPPPTYTPPPPPPPKKHEQMETIHVSRFNNNDFILR